MFKIRDLSKEGRGSNFRTYVCEFTLRPMRNVWLDEEKDRRYELVGRTVKVLYENGWFSGKVKYFNEKYVVTAFSIQMGQLT